MHLTDKKILLTGATSGFGKYVSDTLDNVTTLTRQNRYSSEIIDEEYDIIIHSAFSNERGPEITDYFEFVDGSILLTNELLHIPHKKFVYISSLIVYEDEISSYGLGKKLSEAMVSELSESPLVIRVPALLGKDIRPNTVHRIITEKNPKLTLSKDSKFNYILHSDLLKFIDTYDKEGVVNFMSKDTITLEYVSELFNNSPEWGQYTYVTPGIEEDAERLRSSKSVLLEYEKIIK
jgi:nucleoside-diphosphate-sugar epimerase